MLTLWHVDNDREVKSMAVKPVIKPITPFDALIGTKITATYSGNMPYYNRVVVQDAVTLVTVYDRTIATSEYSHTLDPTYKGSVVAPGDTGYALINGRRYAATIQFFGRTLDDPFLVSDKASFLTRTTPQFYFDGVEDGMIIDSASIGLDLVYEQNESEKLISFRFDIYDNNKKLLQQTDIKYDTSNMTYTFKGLDNLSTYYVRAEGVTKNGIELDTGYWEIRTQYEDPSVYARMFVQNDHKTSEMEYWTNFVLIESEEDPDDFEYEDSYIYLDNGQKVTYSQGFEIKGDATWHIRAKDMDYARVIMRVLNDEGGEFYIEGIRDTERTLRFRLVSKGAMSDYILYTQSVDIDWMDIVNIWIRRINNVYDLLLFVERNPIIIGNLYLEEADPPVSQQMVLGEQDLWFDTNYNIEIDSNDVRIIYQETEPATSNQYNIWIVDEQEEG